ncbi:hypothetical protein [Micromonospora sp. CB01531]|uniref:hypothetical protein n=1 Tax=Micromonospora sp. CB01531 TaxID=1718947 RepID=UPI00093A8B3A|nr:hypothetical protein [Micromonospora sp. CB01531]OKI54556.1 hypothetical protein A6A27_32025 [Micromonospora sp. CB01531]
MGTLKNCPYCDSEVWPDNPVFVATLLERELDRQWGKAESESDYYGWPVGKRIDLKDGLTAEVVDKKIKVDLSELADGTYYGDGQLTQGTTFQVYVILKVGENFYKKTGEGDSYSDITWAGPVVPVKPREEVRTIYVFE